MLAQRRLRKIKQVINGLLVMALGLSFMAAGAVHQKAAGTDGNGVFLPYLTRDATYQESVGVLDTLFSTDGWLLTNFSGSLDFGYAIIKQPGDGKLVMAGSFDGISQDFGVARFNSDGSEDLTFDGDGRVHTDFYGKGDVANAIALQSDGMIVVAGSAYRNDVVRDDFALVRYDSYGSLDDNFGEDGRVTTDFLGRADYATAVVVQADGKIVVAGFANNGTNYDFALARYTTTGELDEEFGEDGRVVTDFDPVYNRSERAYALVIDGDGLVVAGEANNGFDYDFALVRYTATGSLDLSFGDNGIVLTDFNNTKDGGRAVALQPDGKLIVAGFREESDNTDFALVRYDSTGELDDTFGEEGKVETDINGDDDYGYSLALEPSGGDIILGGYIWNGGQNDFALARYTQDGELDSDFYGGGKVFSDFAGRSEWGYGLIQQDDGKLVLAGYLLTVAGSDFAMARYNEDGALDLEFGEDGWAVTNLFGSSDMGLAAAMQPDDKLIVAGWVQGMDYTDFAVARYYSNGSPDLSFDNDGRVVTDIDGDYDYAYAAVVQPDGRIVVAGTAYISHAGFYDDDFALVRYKSDGSPDPTFGGDGKVTTDFGVGNDSIHAVLVQPDGMLVVAGEAESTNGQDFALARYKPDGSLDSDFGTGGRVTTDFFGDDDHGRALARQADGKLLVAGYVTNGSETDFALARYNTTGGLDTTFGTNGRVITDINQDDEGHAIVVQGDGRIVVAGWTFNGVDDDFALVRYKDDGSLDSSFDGDGRVITDISGYDDHVNAISLQPDGKLVVAGDANPTGEHFDIALARYRPDGILDDSFSDDGWLVLDFYLGNDNGQALLIQPGGQLVVAGYADNGTDYDFALVRYR